MNHSVTMRMKSIFVLLAAIPSWSVAAVGAQCQALVNYKNDLWLVSQDGGAARRITSDGQTKNAAALSRAGDLVAYSVDSGSRDRVFILSPQGQILSSFYPASRGAIFALEFADSSMLAAYEHVSPVSSVAHFYSLGQGTNTPIDIGTAEGLSCTVSPNGKDKACSTDGHVEKNSKTIYYVSNPFSAVDDLQSVAIPQRKWISLNTSPNFSVYADPQTDTSIALKVRTPDGQEQEQYVRKGDTMQIVYDDGSGPALFGLFPAPSATDDLVSIRVVRSKVGPITIQGGVAWAPSGQRLAIVEVNALQQARLVIMNAQSSPVSKESADLFSAVLPITGPVKKVEITSDYNVVVTSKTATYQQAISRDLRRFAGDYTVSPALPMRLEFSIGTAKAAGRVYGWSCN